MSTILDISEFNPAEGFTIQGASQGDQAGLSVSSAGDVNGDGIDDFIIGAALFDRPFPNPQPGSQVRGSEAGAAYVIYGREGIRLNDINLGDLSPGDGFSIQGQDTNEYLGIAVSAAGDVNGDGIDDIIVGAQYGGSHFPLPAPGTPPAPGGFEGKAYIIFGQSGTTRSTLYTEALAPTDGFSVQGDNTFDYMGQAVSALGDVNGDGFDDIILGAANGDGPGGGYNAGEAYIIFGKAGPTRSDIDLTNFASGDGFVLEGRAMLQQLGTSVSDAGDVNGDGIADMIIGARLGGLAPFNGYNGSSGQSFVVYGKVGATRGNIDLSNITPADGFRIVGDQDGDLAGTSVSSAGDINGDGIADILIGARGGDDSGANAGEAYVVYGKTGPRGVVNLGTFSASDGFVIRGAASGDFAGYSVSSAGDVNGDGLSDILISAPRNDRGETDAGEVYIIFGKTGAVRGNIDLENLAAADGVIVRGALAGDRIGDSVSAAGDINNDGFDDLIIGAPNSAGGAGGLLSGRSFVVHGRSDFAVAPVVLGSVIGTSSNDTLNGTAGNDLILGLAGNDTLTSLAGIDRLMGGLGNDTLDGGSNVDTAVVSGNRSAYTVTQTSTGNFQVVGPDGTDSLSNIEYLLFADQTIRLLPGTGATVDFSAAASTFMGAIRDFDGNDLGGASGWKRLGAVDVNGDGDADQIFVNPTIGRFAEVATAADGKVYFSDHGWAGETRVVGIYIDPLVQSGEVVAGSDFDSQRRFQNDLRIDNLGRVLGGADYDHDGSQEVYFKVADGTAYLHAYMHADGNIQYANYQTQAQVVDFLTQNGWAASTYDGWFI